MMLSTCFCPVPFSNRARWDRDSFSSGTEAPWQTVQAESCLVKAVPISLTWEEYMTTPFLLKTRMFSIPSWLPRASTILRTCSRSFSEHPEPGGPLNGFTEPFGPQYEPGQQLLSQIANIEKREGPDGEQQDKTHGKAHFPGQAFSKA